MPRVKRLAKWIGLSLAGLALLLALALAGGYAFLQSESGRSLAARQLERTISTPGEFEVRIAGLSGRLPFAASVENVKIEDARGAWLTIENLRYEVDPGALFDATLRIRVIEAGLVRLDRLPETPSEEAPEVPASTEPALPSLPFAIWLERISVQEVALGPAVLGEAASFQVEGDATTSDGSAVDASVTVARSDGEPGTLEATLRYAFAERFLDIEARVEEPAGGLIVRAVGLEGLPALDASLAGRGPLSDWSGDLALTLQGVSQAKVKLRLSGAEDIDFSVTGSADTEAEFEDLPWRLLNGHVAFETAGRWRQPSTLVLERGHVTTPAVDLTVSGIADLENQTVDANAQANVTNPDILRPELPDAELSDLRLSLTALGRLDAPALAAQMTAGRVALGDYQAQGLTADAKSKGPPSQPRLSLDLKVDRLASPEVTAAEIAASVGFAPGAEFDWAQPSGKVTSSGTVADLEAAALADWSPAIGQGLSWDVTADVDAADAQISGADLRLESERARLAASGAFNWRSGATDAKLRIGYPDLAAVGNVVGAALQGRLEATAEITSPGPLGVLDATLAGQLSDLVLPDPIAQSLAAPDLEIGGRVARDRSGSISLADLRAASPAAIVTGDLELGPESSALTATYRAELNDLSLLSPAIGQPVSGAAVLSGRASGRLENLEVSGDLQIAKGSIAAQPIEDLRVEFSAAELPDRPNGQVSARLKSPVGEATASADYLVAEDAVELSALALSAADLEAEGRARVPLAGVPVALELDGRVGSLSPWLALAGLEGDAKGPFRVALEPDGARQRGRLEATLENLRLDIAPGETLTVAKLTATLDGADLLGDAEADLRLGARELAIADLALATAEVEASGGPAGGDYRVSLAGDWFGELRLDTAGRVAIDGERIQVEVSRLAGHAFEQDLALKETARFAMDGASMSLSGLDLDFGEARLQASAARAPDQLSAQVTVTDLPVAALRPVVDLPLADGRADASLQVSGTAAAPEGDLTLELRGARMADVGEVPPVDLSLTGRWRDGVLASSGELTGLSKETVALSLDLPLRLDPESLAPVVPSDGPIDGKLTWQGPIAPLWDLVPAELHELSGMGDVQASVSGTVGQPNLGGAFALNKGRYESLEAGTLLTDLQLDGDLSGNRIQLSRLSAKDGGDGTLDASGTLAIEPGGGLSTDLEAKFRKFTVLRRDDITAVAKGDISVTGSADRTLIEGRIETDTVEIDIPDRLPPDVVTLDVEVEGAPAPDPADPENEAARPGGHRVSFDITIDIPRRAFIRGRGIDSEWAGSLKVSGTGDNMAIKGKLNLVRGQVAALGKTFRLNEGSFTFPGTPANDPNLKIVAHRKTDDLDVTITVSGPLSNPKLALSSVPELPEDEIISRVLFGKSTGQLSAVEAAQLAASVAELTGQSGGASGILGRIRSTLGVDVLRVESTESGDSTTPEVAAGKYLTDDVYIGAKQGADSDSGSAEIEVELTPNISIGSSVGQQGQSEVGINFKWDY